MMSLSININHDNLNELPTEAAERVSIPTRLPGENATAKPAELPGLEFKSVEFLRAPSALEFGSGAAEERVYRAGM